MKALQSLLGWLSYEVAVGLMAHDLLPLSSGPLGERLQRVDLPPARIGGAMRAALRHSLRVLAVAFHGLHGMPGVPEVTARAFEDHFAAAGLSGSRIELDQARDGAVAHCKHVLERSDTIFRLDSLDEQMVFQTLAAAEAVVDARALRLQARLGSFYLKEALKREIPEGSPLLQAPAAYEHLERGLLHFFAAELERIPAVRALLEQMRESDGPSIERRLAESIEADLLAADEMTAARKALVEHLPQRIETAATLAGERAAYQALMGPIVEELDRLYVALEQQRPYETKRYTRSHETVVLEPGQETGRQYVMPLAPGRDADAGEEVSHDPEQVFARANKYFSAGQLDKALLLYNRAIDLDPTLGKAHFNLSQAYIRQGQLSSALLSYQEAVRLDNRLRIVPEEYEIDAILGAGGMGLLFRVREAARERVCTLRVLNPKLTGDARRMPLFITQLKRMRRLGEAGQLQVFDLRKFREHYLLVSEYATGWSLRQVLDGERIPQLRAARIFRELCRQINAAHAGDVLHLNLKPSCIFLDASDQVRIGDFALMCLLEPGDGSLQASGLPLEYLAPEQTAGAEAEESADVYALAMILHELLAGERWRPGVELAAELEIEPELGRLVQQGTDPDPDSRCTLHQCRQAVKRIMPIDDTDSFPRVIRVGEQAAPAAPRTARVTIPPGMALVPAGPFRMGHDGEPHASPEREVQLDAFLIGICPVTNAEYRRFLLETKHRSPFVNAPWTEGYNWKRDRFPPGTDDHPVVLVSWYDALAYAQWAGKRLPTEAEWEKAARGADGRLFPWGDAFDPTLCNYQQKGGAVGPVRQHPDNISPYGCIAMSGNVWEWVADWYDKEYYAKAPATDPSGPATGRQKVLRGGAFDSVEEAVRTCFRFRHPPHTQSVYIGFRLAQDCPS